jgi:hypothetical protein
LGKYSRSLQSWDLFDRRRRDANIHSVLKLEVLI